MPRGRPSRRGRRMSRTQTERSVDDNDDIVKSSQTDEGGHESDSQSAEMKPSTERFDSAEQSRDLAKDDYEDDDSNTEVPDGRRHSDRRLTEGAIDVDDAESVSVEEEPADGDEDSEDTMTPSEKAARICRLPAKETVVEEINMFPFFKESSRALIDAYLCIRNHACLLWSEDPFVQVTVDRLSSYVAQSLSHEHLRLMCNAGLVVPPAKSGGSDTPPSSISSTLSVDPNRAAKEQDLAVFPPSWLPWATLEAKSNLDKMCYYAVLFLERYGYINFGIFKILAKPLTHVSIGKAPSGDHPPEAPTTPRRAAAERALALTRRSASTGSLSTTSTTSPPPFHFLILGAGIAGLTAARQLLYFGAKVTVLESRDRVGGRIWTCKKGDAIGELGAMVVTGLAANPVSVLAKQIPLTLTPINVECCLYDPKGRQISREVDERVEEEFNRLLATAAYLCHTKSMESITTEDGQIKPLSLGEVINHLIRYQEHHQLQLKITHRQLISDLLRKKEKLLDQINDERQNIEEAFDRWQTATARANTCSVVAPRVAPFSPQTTTPSAEQITYRESDILWDPRPTTARSFKSIQEHSNVAGKTTSSSPSEDSPSTQSSQPVLPVYNVSAQFEVRRLLSELHDAWRKFEPLENALNRINKQLELLLQSPPSGVYLTEMERRTLDWHLANLEFANATRLCNLSLRHWDQDDVFELSGEHCVLRDGYGALTDALASSITNPSKESPSGMGSGHIELKCSVKRIVYSDTDVHVDALNAAFSQDELMEYQADAVICTLPLGVLKESIRLAPQRNTPSKSAVADAALTKFTAPLFHPPLPDWKVEAIQRLGFGVLNKVILFFDKCFWDRTQNLFGHVSSTTESRGELFLFWSISDRPVLIALVAGQAAEELEQSTEQQPPLQHSRSSSTSLRTSSSSSRLSSSSAGVNAPIVTRAMQILRGIFSASDASGNGKKQIPNPLDAIVTRWYSDPDSRGSYSYVSVDATGDDYDILSEPVLPTSTPDSTKSAGPPRLYFAGEHTCRCYPATVHGALLSGLREAARIMTTFCPGQTPVLNHGLKLHANGSIA